MRRFCGGHGFFVAHIGYGMVRSRMENALFYLGGMYKWTT